MDSDSSGGIYGGRKLYDHVDNDDNVHISHRHEEQFSRYFTAGLERSQLFAMKTLKLA
jgi:hypothetical protein